MEADKYFELVHAMQSGVRYDIEHNGENQAAADAKHLRTGINVALADAGAVVELLIEKGIFTEEEYIERITKYMEKEVLKYEEKADPDGKIHFR